MCDGSRDVDADYERILGVGVRLVLHLNLSKLMSDRLRRNMESLTIQSVGFTAAYATLITTSIAAGLGVGPGPISIEGAFSNGSHAALLSVICVMIQGVSRNEN